MIPKHINRHHCKRLSPANIPTEPLTFEETLERYGAALKAMCDSLGGFGK